MRLNLSWLLLGLLIAWTLAEGFFPSRYPDLAQQTRWYMGAAGALGILFSIVFHELSHSLVGRLYGLPIGGITLFVFGGIAELRQEPKDPRTEFLMAGAGPLSSLILAGLFRLVETAGLSLGWPDPVTGVLYYLAYINVVLAIFNLFPAYPLDGGRMLRAALWRWRGAVTQATRITSRGGAAFGIMLMLLGVLSFVTGNLVGGIWMFLIGGFIRGAANVSYRQLLLRRFLDGKTAADLMEDDPAGVSPELSLDELVERHVYRQPHRLFPVVEGSRLVGCVSVDAIGKLSPAERRSKRVRDVMAKCSEENCVAPGDDATELIDSMLAPGAIDRKIVADGDRLAGTISLDRLRRELALRLEIDGPSR